MPFKNISGKNETSSPSQLDLGRNLLRNLSVQDFLAFGLNQIAYIKPVHVLGRTAYAINNADGTPLGVIENLDAARVTVRQNDLEPVTLQ